jgi:hypothetical protein
LAHGALEGARNFRFKDALSTTSVGAMEGDVVRCFGGKVEFVEAHKWIAHSIIEDNPYQLG